MNFNDVNNKFIKMYPNIFNYNYAKNALGFQLRLILINEEEIVDANMLNIKKRILKTNKVINFLFNFSLKIISNFQKKHIIFMRANCFSWESFIKIKEDLELLGFQIFGSGQRINDKKSFLYYFISFTWIYDFLERTSSTYKLISIYKCYSYKALDKLLDDNGFLNEFNKSIKIDIKRVSNVLKILKIRSILLNTDQTIFSYIFVQAAKENKLPNAVIAHGNFRSQHLVGVLPIYVEKIFVWTKNIEENINNTTRSNVAKHVDGIKNNIILKNKFSKNKIIFAASPINLYANRNYISEYLSILNRLSKICINYDLIFCPHPQDSNLIKYEVISIGFKWSKRNIYTEAKDARLIIGSHSSFLYEAEKSGFPVIQIKDICFNEKTTSKNNKKLMDMNYLEKVGINNIIKKYELKCIKKNNLHNIVNFLSG